MKRPDITAIKTGAAFKQWYWLKAELIDYCKAKGLSYSGLKFDIVERIANALDGITRNKILGRKAATSSAFKWSNSVLTLATIITDSYTNGPNTRKFFKAYCGEKFHFSIPFMDWMKKNTGKTLGDAIREWERLHDARKGKDFKSIIPRSNQYNQYMRDFFLDNPGRSIADARHYWKLKRSLPGIHKYSRSDLSLKEQKL